MTYQRDMKPSPAFTSNKTFKAVQYLLSAKEERKSRYDIRNLEYSDKLRNISVTAGYYEYIQLVVNSHNHSLPRH